MWRSALLALASLGVLAPGTGPVAAVVPTPRARFTRTTTTVPAGPAAGMLASAIASTSRSGGFALRETVTRSGKPVSSLVARIGRSEGVATLTEKSGAKTAQVVVLQVGAKFYISANLVVLEGMLHIVGPEATKLVHRWLVLPPGGVSGFTVSGGFTIDAVVGILDLVGDLRVLPTRKLGGVEAEGVSGKRPTPNGLETETVYVRLRTPGYPVLVTVSLAGAQVAASFSHWGHQAIPQPVGAVTIKPSWLRP